MEILNNEISNISIPLRSMGRFPRPCRRMFPDSDIAATINTGRIEMQYNINYGLALYYEDKLYAELSPANGIPPKFTAYFLMVHSIY